MREAVSMLRIVLALSLSIFFAALFWESSSGPFGGCEPFAFLTLQVGCSAWPSVLSGFAFVGVFVSISSNRYRYISMALLTLFEISGVRMFLATGGIGGVQWPWIWSWAEWPYVILHAIPAFLGGILALGLHFFATKYFQGHARPGTA